MKFPVAFAVVAAFFAIVVWSCTRPPKYEWDMPVAAQSWDQENLKRNDHGCPTAIFIAPEGNLVQCP